MIEPQPVDLVVTAGHVLCMDGPEPVIDDGAVAVRDGGIVEVGPAADVLARHRGAEVVALPGHALLPGFVNAHTHLAMTMFRGMADDRDLDAFLATVVPVEGPVLTEDRVHRATRAAAVESVCAGVTTALDMYFFVDAALAAADQVGMRVLSGPVMFDGGPGPLAWDPLMDWAQRWLARHPPRPGWRPVVGPHSTYTVSPAHLAEVRDLAAAHGALVHIHAAETAGENELVRGMHGERPVALLADLGLLGPGTVLAHAVHLDDAELAAVVAGGAAVAHCPASNLKLASGVARVPELLAAGATVGVGTDGPASSNDLDVLGATRLAALLHKGVGAPGAGPDAADLPAATALRMATLEGARALGIDDQVGSLEVGKRADLVAIDLDRPHVQPVYDAASAVLYAAGRGDVREVWVDGRTGAAGRRPRGSRRRSCHGGPARPPGGGPVGGLSARARSGAAQPRPERRGVRRRVDDGERVAVGRSSPLVSVGVAGADPRVVAVSSRPLPENPVHRSDVRYCTRSLRLSVRRSSHHSVVTWTMPRTPNAHGSAGPESAPCSRSHSPSARATTVPRSETNRRSSSRRPAPKDPSDRNW